MKIFIFNLIYTKFYADFRSGLRFGCYQRSISSYVIYLALIATLPSSVAFFLDRTSKVCSATPPYAQACLLGYAAAAEQRQRRQRRLRRAISAAVLASVARVGRLARGLGSWVCTIQCIINPLRHVPSTRVVVPKMRPSRPPRRT